MKSEYLASEHISEGSEDIAQKISELKPMVLGYIMTQTGDYSRADDIFQDVCLTICEKISDFEAGTNFKAWAMRITKFKILSHYRDMGRQKKMVQLDEEVAELCANDEMESLGNDFLDEREFLKLCLDKLKGKNKLIVTSRYGQEMSVKEISNHIGWTSNAVSVALSRIRKALEVCIEKKILQRGSHA